MQVLAELREYAQDVDYEMARRAIRALSSICMRLHGALDRCMQILLDLISRQVPFVVQECAVAFRDIFR